MRPMSYLLQNLTSQHSTDIRDVPSIDLSSFAPFQGHARWSPGVSPLCDISSAPSIVAPSIAAALHVHLDSTLLAFDAVRCDSLWHLDLFIPRFPFAFGRELAPEERSRGVRILGGITSREESRGRYVTSGPRPRGRRGGGAIYR